MVEITTQPWFERCRCGNRRRVYDLAAVVEPLCRRRNQASTRQEKIIRTRKFG